ncbi:uncharacterized protein LAESUDRAFT_720451 [Laetiporus sulphureus 93-53]|uniref:Uncharacterized protein n=1 Tax=Laetiporus sulphureus 93-53 TaxID=1314785 RepID=A0A165H4U0_9APHY|nr:uncharacterized protein LAESUDRAFT_720451 [Laetiporus sulphureus 93-53]KZT11245.1 hypothetical protein LAESUDRAFT_720451 [Laetiporus sulphureus 93-53]
MVKQSRRIHRVDACPEEKRSVSKRAIDHDLDAKARAARNPAMQSLSSGSRASRETRRAEGEEGPARNRAQRRKVAG